MVSGVEVMEEAESSNRSLPTFGRSSGSLALKVIEVGSRWP